MNKYFQKFAQLHDNNPDVFKIKSNMKSKLIRFKESPLKYQITFGSTPIINNTKYPILMHSKPETLNYIDFKKVYGEFHKSPRNILKYYSKYIIDMNYDQKHLYQSITSSMAGLDVHMYIETHQSKYIKYTYHGITIYIYYFSENNKPDINHINNILFSMASINNIDLKQVGFTITLIATPLKKYLHNNVWDISINNVNSGSSYPGRSVVIWRYEEYIKVLIHELIHLLKIDQANDNIWDPVIQNIKSIKDINLISGEIRPYEAYTDLTAILLNAQYQSQFCKADYNKLINYEINHSLFQAAKITRHYFINSNAKSLFPINVKQNSSIISYYIVKAALFFNNQETFDFLVSSINFNNRTKEFSKLIVDSWSQKLKDVIKILVNFINKYYETNGNEWLVNNARMSIVDCI